METTGTGFEVEVHLPPAELSVKMLCDIVLWKRYPYGDVDPTKENPTAYLLRTMRADDRMPPHIREWRDEMNDWMPKTRYNWWQRQFPKNPVLDNMPKHWWKVMSQAFVTARRGRNTVGALALSEVRHYDRLIKRERLVGVGDLMFLEIRGFVTADRYRERGIGTAMVEAVLDTAYELNVAPTFAVTTNPAAARVFEKCGGRTDDKSNFEQLYRFIHKLDAKAACWHPERTFEDVVCDGCPLNPGQFWWWPTHLKKQMDAQTVEYRAQADKTPLNML
jgi:RimJ/RimL family protein N-acetyltransferase